MRRGCRQDLTIIESQNCNTHSGTCKICQGNNCNVRLQFQECYECNSRNDPRCARNPKSTGVKTCNWYYSSCLTGIDKLGYTHRKCVADHEMPDDLSARFNPFTICMENRCNDQIFPENRLKCFQCNGEKDCNLIASNKTGFSLEAEPCKILARHDQCFTYINKGKEEI